MSETMFVINSDPVEEKHICWYTERSGYGNKIKLFEVLNVKYKHPTHPEFCNVWVVETKFVKEYSVSSADAAPLILLEASQTTISIVRD